MREEAVLNNVIGAARQGPLTPEAARRIFEAVIAETRQAQRAERKPKIRLVAGRSG